MPKTQTRVLMIGEFQHFVDKGSAAVMHLVADWLKILVDDVRCSLVVAGLPRCQAVIDQNEQLAGRFLAPINLSRFRWTDLDERRYPLGGIVAETFYPVHEVAMGQRPKKSLWFSWGFDPWDEAKDLRRSWVDSFLHSDWPPSEFALSAREPWLLRKLCQRMLRQWKGSEFLQSAYAGVKKSPGPQARILEPVLHPIIQHPDELNEDWD